MRHTMRLRPRIAMHIRERWTTCAFILGDHVFYAVLMVEIGNKGCCQSGRLGFLDLMSLHSVWRTVVTRSTEYGGIESDLQNSVSFLSHVLGLGAHRIGETTPMSFSCSFLAGLSHVYKPSTITPTFSFFIQHIITPVSVTYKVSRYHSSLVHLVFKMYTYTPTHKFLILAPILSTPVTHTRTTRSNSASSTASTESQRRPSGAFVDGFLRLGYDAPPQPTMK
jgi:hypothetical protein